jgi:hypothetical protein
VRHLKGEEVMTRGFESLRLDDLISASHSINKPSNFHFYRGRTKSRQSNTAYNESTTGTTQVRTTSKETGLHPLVIANQDPAWRAPRHLMSLSQCDAKGHLRRGCHLLVDSPTEVATNWAAGRAAKLGIKVMGVLGAGASLRYDTWRLY